jgi:hypothetical protein
MTHCFSEYRQQFQKQLLDEIGDYQYRFSRHQTVYSVALAFTPDETIHLDLFAHHLRRNDKYIPFQSNLCAIIFDATHEAQGIKAASNLLVSVENLFFSTPLYMAVVSVDEETSPFQMVYNLFDLIRYAIEHNLTNEVMDSSQIIRYG